MKSSIVVAGAVGLLATQSWLATAPPVVRADDVTAMKNPYEGDPLRAAQGRSLFNQFCAHCHAPNAISPDPPKDLRRLRVRYAERMPNWAGILPDETLWTIFTFLQSVQSQP